MTQQQSRQLQARLQTWRTQHPDTASRQAAYRQQIISLTLNSMAIEQEPVPPAVLQSLLAQTRHAP